MVTVASVFGSKPHLRPICDTPLDAWLRARSISRQAFSKQMGVSPRTVHLWCNNQVLPDLVNSIRIMQKTEGGVCPEHWTGTDLFKFIWDHDRFDQELAAKAKRAGNRRQYIRRMKNG